MQYPKSNVHQAEVMALLYSNVFLISIVWEHQRGLTCFYEADMRQFVTLHLYVGTIYDLERL